MPYDNLILSHIWYDTEGRSEAFGTDKGHPSFSFWGLIEPKVM